MNLLQEISLEIFLFRNPHASLARAGFPLKLSLIVSEEAISPRRRPPPPERTRAKRVLVDSEVRGTTLQKLIVDSEVRGTTLQS